MRVLVRNIPTGEFYAGGNSWALQSESGFDFKTTRQALKWIQSLQMAEVELVYSYESRQYDVVVPPQTSPEEDMGL